MVLALVCQGRVKEKGRHQNTAAPQCELDCQRRESGSKPSSRLMHTSEIMEIQLSEHQLPFAQSAQILCISSVGAAHREPVALCRIKSKCQ